LTEFGKAIADFLAQQGQGYPDVVIAELREAIAERKSQRESDICCLERELAALGGGSGTSTQ
jgi:hypothetical protein